MTKEDGIKIRQARQARVRMIRSRVVGGSVALFLAVWSLIAVVLITGHDPALARKTTTVSVAAETGTTTATGDTAGSGSSDDATTATGAGTSTTSTSSGSSGATSSSTGAGSSAGSAVTSSQS